MALDYFEMGLYKEKYLLPHEILLDKLVQELR